MNQVPRNTILHVIVGLNDGGAEAVLYRLCSGDTLNKHIVISMMDEGKYAELLNKAGVVVHCLNMERGCVTLGGLLLMFKLIRLYKPVAVQTWMYHADLVGGVIARLLGVPIVSWGLHHANLSPDAVKSKTRMIAGLCAFVSSWVPDVIVSDSHEAVRVHTQLGYLRQKFLVIPNGVDLANFAPDAVARERFRLEITPGYTNFILGVVARFDPQKDHANLFAALSAMKKLGHEFRCVLVGTGMEATNELLMDLLAKEDILDCVILLGRRGDINHVMNAIDLHVLPSYSEAFGNVLVEAMACGTPCVCTNVGDMPLIVGENGWVVPARDSKALADALIAAKQMFEFYPEAWGVRQNEARERALKEFSVEQMRASYEQAWQ
jgi:glycosyltransferase involved in cell wall biosynthesis